MFCNKGYFSFNGVPYSLFIPGSALQTLSQEFSEEGRVRDTAAYMARRDMFTSGLEMERSEQISRREAIRESADRICLSKRVSGEILHGANNMNNCLLHHRTSVI